MPFPGTPQVSCLFTSLWHMLACAVKNRRGNTFWTQVTLDKRDWKKGKVCFLLYQLLISLYTIPLFIWLPTNLRHLYYLLLSLFLGKQALKDDPWLVKYTQRESLSQILWSVYYIPGFVLGSGDEATDKIEESPGLHEIYILFSERTWLITKTWHIVTIQWYSNLFSDDWYEEK